MRVRGIIAAITLLTMAAVVRAQTPTARLIEQAKSATALLLDNSVATPAACGAAFCFDSAGLFITRATNIDGKHDLSLALNINEKSQRIVPVVVRRIDATSNVAILQAVEIGDFTAMPLGGSNKLLETAGVITAGFVQNPGAVLEVGGLPSITVKAGHITSLLSKAGEIQLIQIDAAIDAGESGGALLDTTGHVIGIIDSATPQGQSVATPIDKVTQLLNVPLPCVFLTTLDYARRFDAQRFAVREPSVIPAMCDVELDLSRGAGAVRVHRGQLVDGLCLFNTSLLARPSESAETLIVSGEFEGSVVDGKAVDRSLRIGDRQANAFRKIHTMDASRRWDGRCHYCRRNSVQRPGGRSRWAARGCGGLNHFAELEQSASHQRFKHRSAGAIRCIFGHHPKRWPTDRPGQRDLGAVGRARRRDDDPRGSRRRTDAGCRADRRHARGCNAARNSDARRQHLRSNACGPDDFGSDACGSNACGPDAVAHCIAEQRASRDPRGWKSDRCQPFRGADRRNFLKLPTNCSPSFRKKKQPNGDGWHVSQSLNRQWALKLHGENAVLTGELIQIQKTNEGATLILNADPFNYRGVAMTGLIRARFPRDQLAVLANLHLHDRVTIIATIGSAGIFPNGLRCSVTLDECEIK